MKMLRILPGAAGIIALTATVGFIDGRCDAEAESFSRVRVALAKSADAMSASDGLSRDMLEGKSGDFVYLVDIRSKNRLSEVKVDAVTGRVLLVKAIL